VKGDIQLSSISGGSDINGCFALGNPMGPVYSGELQCRGLGMKVEAFDESGKPVINQQGELVCTAPSPSMPIYFWDDPGNKKYRAAYFDVYPNVWRHGDYILINERGGVIMYGRSDATLNPGGVRIGTAEIYRQVDTIDGIVDSIVVGQNWKNDVRVILFVKMEPGRELTDELKERIRKTIRVNASPRQCAGQDHCRAGHPLYPDHEEGGTFGEEGDRGSTGSEQGRTEESGVTRLLRGHPRLE